MCNTHTRKKCNSKIGVKSVNSVFLEHGLHWLAVKS